MVIRTLLALGALALSTLPGLGAIVVATQFTVTTDKKGEMRTTYEPIVPLTDGTCYYWGIQLKKGGNSPFSVMEEFILPAKPVSFEADSEDQQGAPTVTEDGRTSRRTVSGELSDGWAESGWCVTEGDPLGPHVFSIYEGPELLHRFDFQVVTPAEFNAVQSGM